MLLLLRNNEDQDWGAACKPLPHLGIGMGI